MANVRLGGGQRPSFGRLRAGAVPAGRSRAALHAEIEVNAALNRRTAGLAPTYRPHRERVMRLLREAAGAAGAAHLVILGAGNCNDVDLPELLGIYDAVSLVDLDAAAMGRAVGPLAPGERARVRPQALDMGVPGAGRALGGEGRGASVVLSATVLTQLIAGALDGPGGLAQASLGRIAARQRRQHLALMMRLLAPGGRGILVTDVVSSADEGGLGDPDDGSPEASLARCCAEGRYFAGTRPGDVVGDIARLPGVDHGSLRHSAPWVWTLEGRYSYLVYAALFGRARQPAVKPTMRWAASSGTSSWGQWPTPSSSTQSAMGSQRVR